MTLFGRKAQVIIETDPDEVVQAATVSASAGVTVYPAEAVKEVLTISDLDVRFSINRSLTSNPNKAEINIFNLNSVHRELLEQRGSARVRLLVGYEEEGADYWQIFAGTLRAMYSVKDTPDWVTTIRSGDGDKDAQRARIRRAYPRGALLEQMWRDAAESLNAGLGNALKAYREGASIGEALSKLATGGTLNGPAMKEINRIARMNGLEVSIQDGELLVLEIGKAKAGTAVSLSPSTGLIGSPERGKKGEVKVRSLIVPDLVPGRKLVVRSRHMSGEFRAEAILYKGDSSTNDWYAEITCKELK